MTARTAGLVTAAVAVLAWVWMSGDLLAPEATDSSPSQGARRVVSLDPGITEVIVLLDATDQLVARPDHSDLWPQLADLPKVGTGLTPNYEGIVRARPDLILTTGSRGSLLSDLRSIAPTESLPWLTSSEVSDGIRLVGRVIGRTDAAEQLATEMQEGLRSQVGEHSPTVLLLIGAPSAANPDLWYISSESLHGAALAAAGGRNAISEATTGTPSISMERLLEIDPDIILMMLPESEATGEQLAQHRQFWERLDMLKAVQNKRIDFILGAQHLYIGPGVLNLVELVRSSLKGPSGETP